MIPWDWTDPESCVSGYDDAIAASATVDSMQLLPMRAPYAEADLRSIGIDGVEFATFKTASSSGVGSDLVAVRSGDRVSEPGEFYRIDHSHYFVQADISRALPFCDASVDWVFAEHLIEHVSLRVAIQWLREVRRILRPNGVLRLTTPDLSKYAHGYLGGDFFEEHRRAVNAALPIPEMPDRRAFMLNQIFAFYGHRWIYDYDEIVYALSSAGYASENVRLCEFRDGARSDVAALDREERRDESIYVEVDV